MKKITKERIYFVLFLLSLAFAISTVSWEIARQTREKRIEYHPSVFEMKEAQSEEKHPCELNDSTLVSFLREKGAWYPELMAAQAKLETGNYTSNIFMCSNNLFGMKAVTLRKTTQNGDFRGYGTYDSWMESCIDRILWDLHKFSEKPSYEDYTEKLRLYAEDEEYIEKLEKIVKTLKTLK